MMVPRTRTDLLAGLPSGAAIAFAIALALALVPAAWFLDPTLRAILYAVQIPAGPVFVLIARGVARLVRGDERMVLLWAVTGALAFDGLALGFWPGLYGQTGEALAWMTATLLWAFAWIVAAGLLLTRAHGPSSTASL